VSAPNDPRHIERSHVALTGDGAEEKFDVASRSCYRRVGKLYAAQTGGIERCRDSA
jgi:hypothetical protein